jgi:membrane protease YdiL (CAAX protease family)
MSCALNGFLNPGRHRCHGVTFITESESGHRKNTEVPAFPACLKMKGTSKLNSEKSAALLKNAVIFLAEILSYTLLAQAVAGFLFRLPGEGIAAQITIWFLFGLVLLALGWTFNKLLRRQGMRELGFHYHKSLAADLWLGVCAYAVLNLLSLPFDLAALNDRAKNAHALLEMVHLTSPVQILIGGTVLAGALGFFTGAFHEEIRFRGYYQGAASCELTPLAGVIVAFVPFSFGHYYAQPDWTFVQVLATIIPGIIYALFYNATGSLIVVMTVHTLVNLLSFAGFLMSEAAGRKAPALITLVVLALLSLLLVTLRWNRELRQLREATRKLFAGKPTIEIAAGLATGLAVLALWPHQFAPLHAGLAGTALFGVALTAKKFKSGEARTETRGMIEKGSV